MLIAHISDFHVFADAPETSLVRADVADCTRKVVADIASFKPGIDAVMFTGDLTDGGSADDYALLQGHPVADQGAGFRGARQPRRTRRPARRL